MSTRSRIVIQIEENVYRSVYCHFDGYVDGVGHTLLEHYRDVEKVKSLIELGGISVLGKDIDCPEGHDFENQVVGKTVFYCRDRGEELRVKEDSSVEELVKSCKDSGGEFLYIYGLDGKWMYMDMYGYSDKKLKVLEM